MIGLCFLETMASTWIRATYAVETLNRTSLSQIPKRSYRMMNSPYSKPDWLKEDGEVVRKNDLIRKQKKLKFHPGLYVEMKKDLSLHSMVDGIVIITREKVNAKVGNPFIEKYYKDNECILSKYYYNVIPKPQEKKFRLVDFV